VVVLPSTMVVSVMVVSVVVVVVVVESPEAEVVELSVVVELVVVSELSEDPDASNPGNEPASAVRFGITSCLVTVVSSTLALGSGTWLSARGVPSLFFISLLFLVTVLFFSSFFAGVDLSALSLAAASFFSLARSASVVFS
jgi:hypothetical protein